MRNVIKDVAVKLDPSSSGCEIRCDGDGRLWCPSLSLSSSSKLVPPDLVSSASVSSLISVSSELVSSGLVSSELVSSGLVSLGLVSSELVSSELISSELISSELISSESSESLLTAVYTLCPSSSEPVSSELISSELVSSGLVSSELVSSELISSERISSELVSSGLVSSERISSERISSERISSERISSERISSESSESLFSSAESSISLGALYTLCPPSHYLYIPCHTDPTFAQPVARLQKTIESLKYAPQTYTFTWSSIPAGVAAGPYTTAEVKSPDDFVEHAIFVNEVASAMQMWNQMFESIFSVDNGYANQLTLNFTYEGIETGTPPATGTGIQSYRIPKDVGHGWYGYASEYGNVGEIRVSMHPFMVSTEESHVFSPDGVYGPWSNEGGDIHLNNDFNWRREADAPAGQRLNIRTFLLRDIGQALGFDHWGTDRGDSIMRESLGPEHNLETEASGATVLFPSLWINNAADRHMVETVYKPGNAFPGV